MKYITNVEGKRCRCITVIMLAPEAETALRETVSAFLRSSLLTFLFQPPRQKKSGRHASCTISIRNLFSSLRIFFAIQM